MAKNWQETVKEAIRQILLSRYGTYGLSREPQLPETIGEILETLEISYKTGWEARQKEVDEAREALENELAKVKSRLADLNKKLDDREADLIEAEQRGIRKIVDWIKQNSFELAGDLGIDFIKWQAFLKSLENGG